VPELELPVEVALDPPPELELPVEVVLEPPPELDWVWELEAPPVPAPVVLLPCVVDAPEPHPGPTETVEVTTVRIASRGR
jgi:hypothetical protein